MDKQRWQITESKPVSKDKSYCTVFIEDLAVLGEIPQPVVDTFTPGSVAYTMAPIAVYHRVGNEWRDKNGTVVG